MKATTLREYLAMAEQEIGSDDIDSLLAALDGAADGDDLDFDEPLDAGFDAEGEEDA